MLVGFDLSTKRNGWCAGDGSILPTAGAFILKERENVGQMGVEFQRHVLAIHERFPATHWVIEESILTPRDQHWTLLRIYGVAFLLCVLGEKLGVECKFVHWSSVKAEFAGVRAKKDDMIAMCERLGIALPPTKEAGKGDAADAAGVWKVGVRLFARQHLTRWDQAIYRRQGGLI
jgi:hypothetical protein